MQKRFDDIQPLLDEALLYDQNGDAYNAVKLYKKLVKIAPDWALPYHFLSIFYRERKEWKPAFYYSQKATEYNATDKTAWHIHAIAATALGKWRIARQAWNKLGFDFRDTDSTLQLNLGAIPVCINPKTKPEIIQAQQIGPARARIESIPQPSSQRRYREEILIDSKPVAYRVFKGKRLPVFEELESIRLSAYQTYAVILETADQSVVSVLERLCAEADVGFDNWSKATRQFLLRNKNLLPEFYGEELFADTKGKSSYQLIALAAKNREDVKDVLRNWKIITLQSYRNLVRL